MKIEYFLGERDKTMMKNIIIFAALAVTCQVFGADVMGRFQYCVHDPQQRDDPLKVTITASSFSKQCMTNMPNDVTFLIQPHDADDRAIQCSDVQAISRSETCSGNLANFRVQYSYDICERWKSILGFNAQTRVNRQAQFTFGDHYYSIEAIASSRSQQWSICQGRTGDDYPDYKCGTKIDDPILQNSIQIRLEIP